MTDAEKVLRWLGYDEDFQSGWWMKHGETYMRADDQQDGWSSPIDANWIHGSLIPALEERLRIKYIGYWPLGDEHDVTIAYADKRPNGRGPTFEAAFLAAAAKAVSA